MKANIKVATARDCQESLAKQVDIIVVLLTSFRTSYIFSICTNTAFALHAIKAKADNFFRDRGSIKQELIAFHSAAMGAGRRLVQLKRRWLYGRRRRKPTLGINLMVMLTHL